LQLIAARRNRDTALSSLQQYVRTRLEAGEREPYKGAFEPMANRGPQSFKKRQKEQQRKEKQQEKMAKRLERKLNPGQSAETDEDPETPEEQEEIHAAEIADRIVGG
jgi:hypothetical protein